MIVRPQENWFRMLLVWHGSVLPSVLPQLFLILVVSLCALLEDGRLLGTRVHLDTAPFSLLGISLAIFLAFRNNSSYQRYLEARKLWGNILIAARALTSQVLAYIPEKNIDQRAFAGQLVVFVHLLRHQLRGSDPQDDLTRLLPQEQAQEIQSCAYRPIFILKSLRRKLHDATSGIPNGGQTLWMFDAQLNNLASAVGGCERIASTPIPYPYGVLLHRTIYAYCFLLPFGLESVIGSGTPLISVLVAYTLFSLEAIAQEISDPFGRAPNSLALGAISRNIERSVLELCELPMPGVISVDSRFRLD